MSINVKKTKEVVLATGSKLGDSIKFLPNGIINKTETGIGATTLEVTCARSSIIVEPTRAIVSDKSGKHPESIAFMGGVLEINVTDYLEKMKGKYKKIFVVSDSIDRLMSLLESLPEEDVYNNYFYLVDEAEQYQTEANYRERMSLALEYYPKFKQQNRALVSAFLYPFSNPALIAEPFTTFKYQEPSKRNITLKMTNNPTIETICTLRKLEGNNLIFFNTIEEAKKIIEIGKFPEEECAIYCSHSSDAKAGKFFKHFSDGISRKYNFFTSTFYSGVDIMGDFNVITVVNVYLPHTILPPSKLKQAKGRLRNQCKNDIIISNFCSSLKCEYENYKSYAFEEANKYITIAEYNKINGNQKWYDEIRRILIKNESDGAILWRKNLKGDIVINYEEIDNKYISLRTGNDLYSTPNSLNQYLTQYGNTVHYKYTEYALTPEQIQYINSLSDKTQEDREALAIEIYLTLNKYEQNMKENEMDFSAPTLNELAYETTGTKRKLIEFYIKYKNIDVIKKSKGNLKYLDNYIKTHSFHHLSEKGTLKAEMLETFKIGQRFTPSEIKSNINAIYRKAIPGFTPHRKLKSSTQELKNYFILKENKTKGDRKSAYEIMAVKKLDDFN